MMLEAINQLPLAASDITKSRFVSQACQLSKLAISLKEVGVQADVKLPRIVVSGDRGAGKTSLVEAISGIHAPRGTSTRCPVEYRLTSSDQPWQCQISLRHKSPENNQHVSGEEELFGTLISDKSNLEEMIYRAQLAVLNPDLPTKSFETSEIKSLRTGEKPSQAGSPTELGFSDDVISLDISGPELPNLCIVDLPGTSDAADDFESKDEDNTVEDITVHHMSSNAIILLALNMRNQFNHQRAPRLARQVDPDGLRTIGVLTHPDCIQDGEEDGWLKIMKGSDHTLKHGYFMTRHSSSTEKAKFLEITAPWIYETELLSRMGIPNLVKELSNILGGSIRHLVPSLRSAAQRALESTVQSLTSLPPAPAGTPAVELSGMVRAFCAEVEELVKGNDGHESLLQLCRTAHRELRRGILSTTPNFRPFKDASRDTKEAKFYGEQDDVSQQSCETSAIYLEDVKAYIQSSLARQLPSNVPLSVTTTDLIKRCTTDWDKHCLECFDAIHAATLTKVHDLARSHFGRYSSTSLLADVLLLCDELVEKFRLKTLELIKFQLKLEESPFTLNNAYFSACKDKYLAQYKAAQKPSGPSPDNDRVREAIAMLAKQGFYITEEGLSKACGKEDQYDEELAVMAETSAYFRVAYQRVIDNIPRVVDYGFMRATAEDLYDALVRGLHLGSNKAVEHATAYLSEDAQVKAERKRHVQKKEQLGAALKEIFRLEVAVSQYLTWSIPATVDMNSHVTTNLQPFPTGNDRSESDSSPRLVALAIQPCKATSNGSTGTDHVDECIASTLPSDLASSPTMAVASTIHHPPNDAPAHLAPPRLDPPTTVYTPSASKITALEPANSKPLVLDFAASEPAPIVVGGPSPTNSTPASTILCEPLVYQGQAPFIDPALISEVSTTPCPDAPMAPAMSEGRLTTPSDVEPSVPCHESQFMGLPQSLATHPSLNLLLSDASKPDLVLPAVPRFISQSALSAVSQNPSTTVVAMPTPYAQLTGLDLQDAGQPAASLSSCPQPITPKSRSPGGLDEKLSVHARYPVDPPSTYSFGDSDIAENLDTVKADLVGSENVNVEYSSSHVLSLSKSDLKRTRMKKKRRAMKDAKCGI